MKKLAIINNQISQANLVVQEARLNVAQTDLNKAQAILDEKQGELDVVQAMYDSAMKEKQVLYAKPQNIFSFLWNLGADEEFSA